MIHSKCHVILSDFSDTLLPNLFRTWGWEFLCERPVKCPSVFIQEFYFNIHTIDTSIPQFTTIFWGTRIIVILKLISEVLHVPRVINPNYPSSPKLKALSRDEFATHFCERLMSWGDTLNFATHDFTKCP